MNIPKSRLPLPSRECSSDGDVVLPAVPEQWMDADGVDSQRAPDSVTFTSDNHRRPEHPAGGTRIYLDKRVVDPSKLLNLTAGAGAAADGLSVFINQFIIKTNYCSVGLYVENILR